VFTSVRRRGLDDTDPSLMYAEWSCIEDDDPADPRSWAQANPGLGYRIRQDHIAAEYRALRHSPKTFAVERLGIGAWPSLLADEHQPVISGDLWATLALKAGEAPVLTGMCALAVDRSPGGQVWTIASAVRTQTGACHVEIGFHGHASNHEALEKILRCVAEFDPCCVVIDAKSSAAPLRAYLDEAGVEATLTNAADFVLACGGFVDDVSAARISHTDQAPLTAAVANGVRRELPAGGWLWNKKTTEAAISPLVAATLSHYGLLAFAPPPKRKTALPMAAAPTQGRGGDDNFRDMDRIPF
jgi:hypothetical protein